MAKNIEKIAAGLGEKVVAKVPHTGGGAFGQRRLARIVADIQARLEPGQGLRPGRPTDASWVRHPKVPMSEATRQRLVSPGRAEQRRRAQGQPDADRRPDPRGCLERPAGAIAATTETLIIRRWTCLSCRPSLSAPAPARG